VRPAGTREGAAEFGKVARVTGLGTGAVHKLKREMDCLIALTAKMLVRLAPKSCRECCIAEEVRLVPRPGVLLAG
jgi:hypothetical protein